MKEVYILIGLNMNHIMPEGGTGVDKSGGIKVKRSRFGCGWVVRGVVADDMFMPVQLSLFSQAALVRCARVNIVPEPPLNPYFWEYDQMGVKPPQV